MLPIVRSQIEYLEVPISDVISKFTLPPFQRNKDESHVEQLFQKFLSYYDVHKDVILTGSISIGIKEVDSEWIVFDGQHRLHALSKLLAVQPIHDICIRVDIYHVDTEEQILALYQAINTSEKVTLYRNMTEAKTAPAFDAWFQKRYGVYCKSTLAPKGLNVNVSEIMKRMTASSLFSLPMAELISRVEALIHLYSQTSHDTWVTWGVDAKRLALVGNGAYPFYLGVYRHYEWIHRLLDASVATNHYTTTTHPRITIPKKVRLEVWNKRWHGQMNGLCKCCNEPVSFQAFHVGHIVALSRGGDNSENNLEVICATCNLDMGTMHLTEYASLFVK